MNLRTHTRTYTHALNQASRGRYLNKIMVKSESSLPCGKSEIISITNTSSTSGDDKIKSTHVLHPAPPPLQTLGKFGNQNTSCTISMGNERGGGHKCTLFDCHLILGFTFVLEMIAFLPRGRPD